MASQYDMLSYVGSEIDEIKMDHLSFFKLFHQAMNSEESNEFDRFLEIDP